jgi:N-acetylmuramoyl-L-alanine amidase
MNQHPKREKRDDSPDLKAVRGSLSLALSAAFEKRTGRIVEWVPSPHFSERKAIIDTIVVHYTAIGSLRETISLFQEGDRPVSAHFVVGKDGMTIQMVDLAKKAWHAGKSEFEGKADVNDFSIGIELVNWGPLRKKGGSFFAWPRNYGTEYQGGDPIYAAGKWWDPYTDAQYEILTELIREIQIYFPAVEGDRIVGHETIARPPGRKIDPGPAFGWERILIF